MAALSGPGTSFAGRGWREAGIGLVDMTAVEQRYRAVLAGRPLTEVAAKVWVSRLTLHSWLARYRDGGLWWSGGPVAPTGAVSASEGCGAETAVCELHRHPPQ